MPRRADEFAPVIDELTRDSAVHFGAAHARIEPLRCIRGPYSTVLRVGVHAGSDHSHAYIKVFKPRGPSPDDAARVQRFLLREYRAATALHAGLAADRELGALRPLACFPQHSAIVTAEVSGKPFADLLISATGDEVCRTARRIGRWIRTYQQLGAGEGEILLSERRAYIDERLRLLVPEVLAEPERQEILARLDELIAETGAAVPSVAIHADLTPTNVLVGPDGRVTVLDFTMAKTGTDVHDLSHMYFHFEAFRRRRPGRATIALAAGRALLEGFDPKARASDPLFQVMLWQHAICHLAMLAERRVRFGRTAQCWYIRRRWKALRAGLEIDAATSSLR